MRKIPIPILFFIFLSGIGILIYQYNFYHKNSEVKIENKSENKITDKYVGIEEKNRWVKFDNNLYIDPFSKEDYGIFEKGITVLNDFEVGQSAMTFGISEVTELIFDCQNSRIKYNGTVWYSKKFAKGDETKKFPADFKWQPIPYHYIKLFAAVCG